MSSIKFLSIPYLSIVCIHVTTLFSVVFQLITLTSGKRFRLNIEKRRVKPFAQYATLDFATIELLRKSRAYMSVGVACMAM